MNILLQPDTCKKLVKIYHKSGKIMFPLICGSLFSDSFHPFNIMNISYHSYFSTSCVITDYIKPKLLSSTCRVVNLKLHILASFGFVYKFVY